LAAAIKNKLGIEVDLKEGHDKVFEVTVDSKLLFTNNRKCGNLPKNEEMLCVIEGYVAGNKSRVGQLPGGGGTCGCPTEGGSCCG